MSEGEVYHFDCVNRYNPLEYGHGRDHIAIDPGDSLEVSASALKLVKGSLEKPQGWLQGRNVTKGTRGLFPGVPYLHFVRKELNDSGYEGNSNKMKLVISCVLLLALFAASEAVKAVKLSNKDKLAFVNAHNRVRSKLKLPGLRWNDKLANAAARAAETCECEHTDMPYGENIFCHPATRNNNAELAVETVNNWASEKKFMRGNNWEPCKRDCGHYSQMVWRNTKNVGCAITRGCPTYRSLVFCEYNPPGNFRGQKAY